MKKYALLAIALISPIAAAESYPTFSAQYNGFNVILDCNSNLPIYAHYKATLSERNEARASRFYLDKDVPSICQQTSAEPYKLPYMTHHQFNRRITYDRGQLVPSDDMKGNKESVRQTNFMTNVIPMTTTVSRTGAWKYTEELTNCTRAIKDFDVHAGVIIGDDSKDDYFINSHGVPTPDYLWKVLFDGQNIIAWIIPNAHNAIRENLPQYRASVSEIEERTGLNLPIPAHFKPFTHQSDWDIPSSCIIIN